MSQSPAEIYQEVILSHNRNPNGIGPVHGATHRGEAFNAICGDQISVELKVVEGRLERAGFTAKSCALCRASASVMIGLIAGRAAIDIAQIRFNFEQMIAGHGPAMPGDAAAFSAMVRYPARLKCVALPWKALEDSKI